MEAQQWFTPFNGDIRVNSKHTHIGACVPVNQTISGILTIDVLAQLHNMPDQQLGEIHATLIVQSGTKIQAATTNRISLDCTQNLYACSAVYRLSIDTTLSPFDGYYSIQLIGTLDDIGNSSAAGLGFNSHTTLNFRTKFSNGKPMDTTDASARKSVGPNFGVAP